MIQIHATQIRAARAILDWSQDDLAHAAGLAVSTIRNLETGYVPRGKTAELIRQAIERAGLEFIDQQGVRRRTDEVHIIEGADSCEVLFEDMVSTVRKSGSDVIAVMKSQKMLAQSCGFAPSGKPSKLHRLVDCTDVLCLLPETAEEAPQTTQVQFRKVDQTHIGPMPYYLYGNRHVLVLQEGEDRFRFVVCKSPSIAQSYRMYFLSLWGMAAPLIASRSLNKTQMMA